MAAPAVTNTFTNGLTASATEVNQNFTDLVNGITDGTKDLTISALTVGGTGTFNGNVTLGNASADDVTITGSLAATVAIKTNNSFDIGSAALGLASVYLGAPLGRSTRVRANQSLASSYTVILPDSGPAVNQIPQTDASGNLSWSYRNIVPTVSKTAAYTVATADEVIFCDTTTAFTLTLPAAASNTGKVFRAIKTTSDTNALTIDPNGAETIDGVATTTVNTQYEALVFISDGTNWLILERKIPSVIVSYTPTGGWTTNTTYTGKWRRVGDIMELWGYITLAGAPNAADLTVNLPSGYTIDTAKILSTTVADRLLVGAGNCLDETVQQYPLVVAYNSTTSVGLYAQNAAATYLSDNPLVSQAIPFTFGNLDTVNFYARVPISGWKG